VPTSATHAGGCGAQDWHAHSDRQHLPASWGAVRDVLQRQHWQGMAAASRGPPARLVCRSATPCHVPVCLQMYREVWNASAGVNGEQTSKTRERLRRWVKHHSHAGIFPPDAVQAMQQAIDPGAAPAPVPGAGRVDPRSRVRPQAAPPQPAGPVRPPVTSAAAPTHSHASYGVPFAHGAPQWHAPGQLQPGVPAGALPYMHAHQAPMDPLAQYRAAQSAQGQGLGTALPPPPSAGRPLGTSFKGVRLQVRSAARQRGGVILMQLPIVSAGPVSMRWVGASRLAPGRSSRAQAVPVLERQSSHLCCASHLGAPVCRFRAQQAGG
jgi:hypothetical protein